MIRLVYLEMGNFRSFRKPVRIEFPANGLVQLKGNNLDTGGSSGSGKSSIGLALQLALGECDIPSTELGSWGTKNGPTVGLGLNGSHTVEIARGKKLELTVDGVLKDGSAAQKAEDLKKVFGGLNPEVVQALTYRGQRQPGLFLNKTNSEKQEFLTPLLSLDKFEAEYDATMKKVTVFEQEQWAVGAQASSLEMALDDLAPEVDVDEVQSLGETMRQRIAGRQGALKRIEDACQGLRNDQRVVIESAMQMAQPGISEKEAIVTGLRAKQIEFVADTTEIERLSAIVEQCNVRIARLTSEDTQRRVQLEQKRAAMNKSIQALNLKAGASEGLLRDKDRIGRELKKLVVDVCPTCEREWDRAQEKRAQLQEELAQVEGELDECALIMADVEALIRDVGALPKFEPNPNIAKLNEMSSTNSAKVAAEKQKIAGAKAVLEAERRREIAEAEGDLAKLKASTEASMQEIRQMFSLQVQDLQVEGEEERRRLAKDQAGLAELENQLGRIQARAEQAAKVRAQLDVAKEKYDALDAKVKAEKDFAVLIKEFLGSIFDEILQEISDETNQILGSVANTRHVTLQFRSENITNKGTVKKEIRPVVTIHGYEAPIHSGLSGGMLSTVELAVDLAVGAVISRRSGVCPGWLILDESFDGLDTVSKESCLEILQKYANDRLVLVVDHMSEIQGMFTHSITVEYQGGESRIAA